MHSSYLLIVPDGKVGTLQLFLTVRDRAAKEGVTMAIKRFSDKQRRQYKQRVMLVASLLFFFATTGFSLTNFFKQVQSTPAASGQATVLDPLQQEAQGYEIVLEREPNNQAALEGLMNARLQMNDAPGAIEPLEKLVQLHPDRTDYATLLGQLRQQANAQSP